MASSRLLSAFRRLRSGSFAPLFHRSVFSTAESPMPNFHLAVSFCPTLLHNTAPGFLLRLLGGYGGRREFSHGTVNLVIREGKPKFETQEHEPTKKYKWLSKKRLKMKRMQEKKKRREANKRDPRCLRQKGKRRKPRLPDAEARLKYKIEKAKIKEALLVEKLKNYEVPKLQGPSVNPEILTGEERFYMKKMAQKRTNYVPVGRRGVFGGVVLNMHLHWKKHETVKVICKPCKPGQIHEYAREIARLSGGTPIQVIGNDSIIFYRGKNYVQPEVMSPIDTLSKKRALEKSKYEQSLETVRHFIEISEKELELYHQHIALYGDPSCRSTKSGLTNQKEASESSGTSSQPKEVFSDNLESSPEQLLQYESESGLLSISEDVSEEEFEESSHAVVDGPYMDFSDTKDNNKEIIKSMQTATSCFMR